MGGIIGGNFGGHKIYFRFGGFFVGIIGGGLELQIISILGGVLAVLLVPNWAPTTIIDIINHV